MTSQIVQPNMGVGPNVMGKFRPRDKSKEVRKNEDRDQDKTLGLKLRSAHTSTLIHAKAKEPNLSCGAGRGVQYALDLVCPRCV